jgi:hypothetical protein
MLFVPMTWRANLCARKFISFEAFEHEKIPNEVDESLARAAAKPDAARSSASSQLAGRKTPPSRTSGVVRRPCGAWRPFGFGMRDSFNGQGEAVT